MAGKKSSSETCFDMKTTYDFSLTGISFVTFSPESKTFGPDSADVYTEEDVGNILIEAVASTI